MAKAAIKAVGVGYMTRLLANAIGRFVTVQLANRIAGTVVGFLNGTGGWSIGSAVANHWDRFDSNRNNGWMDI